MGYDRQRSPFATRLFLTCYCLFLLVNVLLHTNYISQIEKETKNVEYDFKSILLGFISLSIFSINFYGIWFARIVILCFIVFLFSMLLGTSLITLVLLITNVLSSNFNAFLSLKSSLYIAHNYLWLFVATTPTVCIVSLTISCLFNIFALWAICHLCSCIEHRQNSCPYRKTQQRSSPALV